MIDGSVDEPGGLTKNGVFVKKFVSHKNDEQNIDIIAATLLAKEKFNSTKSGILQMDIEGNEFHVCNNRMHEIAQYFKVFVIEVHFLDLAMFPHIENSLLSFFEEIGQFYNLLHRNDNLGCGRIKFNKTSMPRVIELTYLKKNID